MHRPALKDAFKDNFYIGVALSLNQISGNEPNAIALVEKHFNSITPENILKWEEVHPEPNKYNFETGGPLCSFWWEAQNIYSRAHSRLVLSDAGLGVPGRVRQAPGSRGVA